MTEKKKNLSEFSPVNFSSAKNLKIGIIVSEWNNAITSLLKDGAYNVLIENGVEKSNISVCYVPGSFELPTGAVMMLEANEELDAVICLGCVIQGETRHFEFISQAVATGIMKVAIDYNTPVIFGLLTCDTMQQAEDRAGGKYGNKGIEAAFSCLKMLSLERKLRNI